MRSSLPHASAWWIGVSSDPHRAEHLDGQIGDPLQHSGHRDLEEGHVAPGTVVAGPVKEPRTTVSEQPRLFEFNAGFGDPALHGIVLDHGAPERRAFGSAHHHQLDQQFA